MPRSPIERVVAHWHKLVEDFETSPLDFYSVVESCLSRRSIPGIKTARVSWSEGGAYAANREYFQIIGDRYVFDVCAARFGTGFFFSSWVTPRPARLVWLAAITVLVAVVGLAKVIGMIPLDWLRSFSEVPLLWSVLNVAAPLIAPCLSLIFVLGGVGLLAHAGVVGLELAVLEIPAIGWLYGHLFAPVSYYRLDSLKMFMTAVHTSVLEAVDATTAQQGLRALTEEERKPILRQLM